MKLGPFLAQARVGTGTSAQYAAATGMLNPGSPSGSPTPTANVVLKLPRTGAVNGQVLDESGANAVANAQVTIENRDQAGPLGAFTLPMTTDGGGLFTASNVPVGNVRVSAFSGLFGGSATGLLTAGSPTPATINVRMGSLVKLSTPYTLTSSEFRFDVACQGQLVAGGRTDGSWLTTYALAYELWIGEAASPCVNAAAFEDGKRELRLDGGLVGGLLVTRKIFAPETGGLVRFLEVLTNPGVTPRSLLVSVSSMLGDVNHRATVVTAPASTGNTYAVGQLTNMGSVGFAFAGPGAAVPAAEGSVLLESDSFAYGWNVTVAPGQTVILMHFRAAGFGSNGGVRADVGIRDAGPRRHVRRHERGGEVAGRELPGAVIIASIGENTCARADFARAQIELNR